MGGGWSRSKLDPRFDERVVAAARKVLAARVYGLNKCPHLLDTLLTPRAWHDGSATAEQKRDLHVTSGSAMCARVLLDSGIRVDALEFVTRFVLSGGGYHELLVEGYTVTDVRDIAQVLFESVLRVVCVTPQVDRFSVQPPAWDCVDPITDPWPLRTRRTALERLAPGPVTLLSFCAAARCWPAVHALLRIQPHPPLWTSRFTGGVPLTARSPDGGWPLSAVMPCALFYALQPRGFADDFDAAHMAALHALLDVTPLHTLAHAPLRVNPHHVAAAAAAAELTHTSLLQEAVHCVCRAPYALGMTPREALWRFVCDALLPRCVPDDGSGVDVLATEADYAASARFGHLWSHGKPDKPTAKWPRPGRAQSERTSVRGIVYATLTWLEFVLAASPAAADDNVVLPAGAAAAAAAAAVPTAAVIDAPGGATPSPPLHALNDPASQFVVDPGGWESTWLMRVVERDGQSTTAQHARQHYQAALAERRHAAGVMRTLLLAIDARLHAVRSFPETARLTIAQVVFGVSPPAPGGVGGGGGGVGGLEPVLAIVCGYLHVPQLSDARNGTPRALPVSAS